MRMVFVVLLGICAIHDLRNREIPAFWIWTCIGTMGVYRFCRILEGKNNIWESLLCLFPGILILLFSHIGRQVGSGDGLLMIAGGLCWEQEELAIALTCAFVSVGLFSTGCILFAKKGKETRIPFVPFLFLGTVICRMGVFA